MKTVDRQLACRLGLTDQYPVCHPKNAPASRLQWARNDGRFEDCLWDPPLRKRKGSAGNSDPQTLPCEQE